MWYGSSRYGGDATRQHLRLDALADILLETPPVISSEVGAARESRSFAGVLAELTSQDIWDHQSLPSQDVWDHQASSDCGPAWLWKAQTQTPLLDVVQSATRLPASPSVTTPKPQAQAQTSQQLQETLLAQPQPPSTSPLVKKATIEPQSLQAETLRYEPFIGNLKNVDASSMTLPYEPFTGDMNDDTVRYVNEEGDETLKYESFAVALARDMPMASSVEDEGSATIAYEPYSAPASASSSSRACCSGDKSQSTTSLAPSTLTMKQIATPQKSTHADPRRLESDRNASSNALDADRSEWLAPVKRRRSETTASSDGISMPHRTQKRIESTHQGIGTIAQWKRPFITPAKQLTLLEAWTRGA